MTKLPALTPDDPLRAAAAAAESDTAPAPTRRGAAPARARQQPATPRAAPSREPASTTDDAEAKGHAAGEKWSGASDVTTLRLPVEVLHALHKRAGVLGIAKGMTVAAALLELLRRTDDELVELVEETQQRYDAARRRARRSG
jgi:chemotaxis protein histidine kinase CheA